MIRLLITFILLSSFASCNKIKENVQEKRAMEFITTGQWKVKSLIKNGTNYASAFATYLLQFKSNGKVDAINNGAVEITGDWEGNIDNATIKSNFPTNAAYPVPLLNGAWLITDGGSNYTVASKSENGETSVIRLERI